jgi:hypothetical protein
LIEYLPKTPRMPYIWGQILNPWMPYILGRSEYIWKYANFGERKCLLNNWTFMYFYCWIFEVWYSQRFMDGSNRLSVEDINWWSSGWWCGMWGGWLVCWEKCSQCHLVGSIHIIVLGDTPCVAAGIFKKNFKVKCESRNIKEITWRYSSIKNIIYESMLILLKESYS